jgi:hypothetical protein
LSVILALVDLTDEEEIFDDDLTVLQRLRRALRLLQKFQPRRKPKKSAIWKPLLGHLVMNEYSDRPSVSFIALMLVHARNQNRHYEVPLCMLEKSC